MHKQIVGEIDPSLGYVRALSDQGYVIEVESGGIKHVLKTETPRFKSFIRKEYEVLQIARGVPGINHLVREYRDIAGFDLVLLKEFFPGEDLRNLKTKIADTKVQRQLLETVKALHSLGVGCLDILPKNVLLSLDGTQARLFDFDTTILARDCICNFEEIKTEDFRRLETMIFS